MQDFNGATIAEFMRYNNWANQEVLSYCEKLNAGELDATTPGTYGTIRDTLEHIVRGEATYLKRLSGEQVTLLFQWQDKPTIAAMREYAANVGETLLNAFLKAGPTQMVREQQDGETFEYQAIVLMIQTINHGVEHRTNITTTLVQQNLKPPEVDGWNYWWTHKERFGKQE